MPSAKSSNDLNYEILEIREQNERYSINVYYPVTKFDELNLSVKDSIYSHIEEFKNEVSKFSPDKTYSLNITFKYQREANYITFVFEINSDFCCLNVQKSIDTITYDINKNKIININDLIYKNQDLLEYLSKFCYEELRNREYIKKLDSDEFIVQGTKPLISNFDLFSLGDGKLTIYFEQYQIVPHHLDIQKVEIPLNNIDI